MYWLPEFLFFYHLGGRFWKSVLLLRSPVTPPVFPGSAYPTVNGSLWTISYEFRCYLLVALFGVCGLLRRRTYWFVATVFLLAGTYIPWASTHLSWSGHTNLTGNPSQTFRLTSVFFIGGCFYLFSKQIPFRRWLAIVSAIVLFLSAFSHQLFELGLTVCGGYLLFYGAQRFRTIKGFHSFPDVSYGIYLYGWPVEILWVWYFRGSPWVTFLVATILCIGLGWLSWHYVERPMLTLKRKSSVRLPVG